MGNLEDLVSKEADAFVSKVKGLVKDHLEHEHDDPSPQTIEENFPSTVEKPAEEVSHPSPAFQLPEDGETHA